MSTHELCNKELLTPKSANRRRCLHTQQKNPLMSPRLSFPAPLNTDQMSPLSSAGIIHNDLSDQNILMKPDDGEHHQITGVLDFSLLWHGYVAFDVAISIAYVMLESSRPLDVGGAILAGYESIVPLRDVERSSVYPLVLARLCLSLVHGRVLAQVYPENAKYLFTTAKSGTRLLNLLWGLGKQEVERKWCSDSSKYSDLSGKPWCSLAMKVK